MTTYRLGEQLALPLTPPSRDVELSGRITSGWENLAKCRGMPVALFFPADDLYPADLAHAGDSARAVCNGCRVRSSCRATALLNDEAGVWGGTTAADRDNLRAALSSGASVDAVLTTTITTTNPEAAA